MWKDIPDGYHLEQDLKELEQLSVTRKFTLGTINSEDIFVNIIVIKHTANWLTYNTRIS